MYADSELLSTIVGMVNLIKAILAFTFRRETILKRCYHLTRCTLMLLLSYTTFLLFLSMRRSMNKEFWWVVLAWGRFESV
jgi:hypothetical protein